MTFLMQGFIVSPIVRIGCSVVLCAISSLAIVLLRSMEMVALT